MCKSRFKAGMKWLGHGNFIQEDFFLLDDNDYKIVEDLASIPFQSAFDLRLIKIDGADIGLAALGSLISLLREPELDVVSHRQLVVSALKTAAIAYFSIRNHLKRHQPDKFVVFNGRFAELRSALCAAQSENIPAVVHERSGVLEKYGMTAGTSPHDLNVMKKIIEEVYSSSPLDLAEKIRIAAEWYGERRDNKPQSWYSFAENQQKGVLPNLSSEHCNVVIFNSSEDEMEAFDYWKNPIYKNQTEGIGMIAETLCSDPRFRLFLRIHPNLRGINNSQIKAVNALKIRFPSLTVISADSPVSSYDLMDASDIVISFGSTVGLEAANAAKVVILLGRAIYEDLNCCIKPKSHEEFRNIINRLVSGDRVMVPDRDSITGGTTKYGFFKKKWGENYIYVNPISVSESRMIKNGKEKVLKCPKLLMLVDRSVQLVDKKCQ
jgi:hypothetical protein